MRKALVSPSSTALPGRAARRRATVVVLLCLAATTCSGPLRVLEHPALHAQDSLPESLVLADVWTSRAPSSVWDRLRQPRALAVDERQMWVLEDEPPALVALTADGRLAGRTPLPMITGTLVSIAAAAGHLALISADEGLVQTADGREVGRWWHDFAIAVTLAPGGPVSVARRDGRDGFAIDHRALDGTLLATWQDDRVTLRRPRAIAAGPGGLFALAADGAAYLWRDGAVVGIARADGWEGPDFLDVTFDDEGALIALLAAGDEPQGQTRLLLWDVSDPTTPVLRAEHAWPGMVAVDGGPSVGTVALIDQGSGDFDRVGLLRWAPGVEIADEPELWAPPPPAVGRLRGPRHVTVTANGDVYLADDAGRVHRWSPAGEPLDAWAVAGVRDIAPAPSGDGPCLLAGAELRCMDPSGRTLFTRDAHGWAVAIDGLDAGRGGRVAMIDIGTQSLITFGPGGAVGPGWALGTPADFVHVADLALAPVPGGQRALLASWRAEHIAVHNADDGARLATWPLPSGAERLVSRGGATYVLARDGWAWKLGPDGTPLAAWRAGADAAGTPADVSAAADGRVFLTDPDGDKVLVYAPADGTSLRPHPPGLDDCEVHVDKHAAPNRLPLGEVTTVTLEVTGACPRLDGAVDLVLVVDVSTSMVGTPLVAAQQAAAAMLGQLTPGSARAALVTFSTSAEIAHPLNGDLAGFARAIGALRADGMTRFVPALEAARRAFQDASPRDVPRVVVFMTDGRPSDGPLALPAAAALWSEAATVYTIGFGSDVDEALMRRLASRQDLYSAAPTAAHLIALFRDLGAKIAGGRLLDQARVTDEIPIDMSLVPDSLDPPGVVTGKTLTWTLVGVPTEGIRLTYQLRPMRAGQRPTNVVATLDYVDAAGMPGERLFPVPRVFVSPRLFLPWTARSQCRPRRVDVALVIDTSNSMRTPAVAGEPRTKLEAAQEAAISFIEHLSMPGDRAAVIAFDGNASVAAPLGDDRNALTDAIAALTTGAGTRIDLGLRLATMALHDTARLAAVRPVAILLTDGHPSGGTGDEALAAAREARVAGVAIYTIGLGSDVDPTLLAAIAGDESRSFLAPDGSSLRAIYDAVAGDVLCE